MIWIVIALVLWIIAIVKVTVGTVKMKYTTYRYLRSYDLFGSSDTEDKEVRDYSVIAGTVLGGFLAVLFFCFIANAISSTFIDTTPRVQSTYNLYNLADANSSGGRLFLGSGTIENVPVFSYYTDGKAGGYVLAWKSAAESSVFEDNNPRMEVIEYVYDDSIWFIGGTRSDHHYNFYVPNGSVKPVYNLDAQ